MLTKRVIPCMDVKDGRVVKGVNFVNLRDAGDPIELAQRYDEQKADEVIFLDITATSDGRATTVDMASRASEELHLPYCVGGGFRSVEDIRTMIAAGADKVSINSAALANPELITIAAAAFGTQAILCAIDAKQVPAIPISGKSMCMAGVKIRVSMRLSGQQKQLVAERAKFYLLPWIEMAPRMVLI